jgi:hypothetical protein
MIAMRLWIYPDNARIVLAELVLSISHFVQPLWAIEDFDDTLLIRQ